MNEYLRDVLNQSKDIAEAVNYYFNEENIAKLTRIKNLVFDNVIFTGMGSSHYCACSASAYLNSNGVKSRVVSAGELLHYEYNMIRKNTLVVAISQSGESAEIVRLINRIEKDVKVIGITNNETSPLAKRADILLNLNVKPEKSVSTRTYISSTILCLLLSYSILGKLNDETRDYFIRAVESIDNAIKICEENKDRLLEFLNGASYITLLARGYNIGTAYAGALFIQELSKFPAYGMDAAEFRHGPMEIVDETFRGIIVAPSGLTCDLNLKLAKDISKFGGKAILLTDVEESLDKNNIICIKMDFCDEQLTPVFYILPIQYLDNLIAEKKGLKVGEFRWGEKVTKDE
ncbi:MAG TPA: SIS domain-containing protein [Thermoanaerobacterales bacterium]|nr:SIS domain-containing protein [Thermoanaerobacterales bacterium]